MLKFEKNVLMYSIDPKNLTTQKLHSFLLSAIAPRPIAFASTVDALGRPNLSPYSFFNVFSANPPILIFSPARRVTNNTTKHTLNNVEATKEVVINVVNFDLVQQMSLSSSEYPEGVNEFEKAGLEMLPSDCVKPFRVAQSPVQFECKVNNIVKLGTEGGAGNLVICEVLKLHISKAVLNEDETINQEALDLVSRAGGNYYSRANKGFFEIPKPLKKPGIGIDLMPNHIKNSKILSGNDLGMLGNIEALPSEEEIQNYITSIQDKYPDLKEATQEEKHKIAKTYLKKNDIKSAWNILLS